MELVSICLMALGLCLRGEQLLLIRGRLDCNSNVFFFPRQNNCVKEAAECNIIWLLWIHV